MSLFDLFPFLAVSSEPLERFQLQLIPRKRYAVNRLVLKWNTLSGRKRTCSIFQMTQMILVQSTEQETKKISRVRRNFFVMESQNYMLYVLGVVPCWVLFCPPELGFGPKLKPDWLTFTVLH